MGSISSPILSPFFHYSQAKPQGCEIRCFSQGQTRGKMWEEFSWKAKIGGGGRFNFAILWQMSTSSGWIDIFRVDRHLQGGSTNKEGPTKKPFPKEEGQLAFSNRHSGKCYKQKDQSENWPHFRNNHDTPITRWWLSFNPCIWKLCERQIGSFIFPPRDRGENSKNKKTFETTTQPVVQSAKWPKWNVPPAVPAILSPLVSLLELPSSLVLHSPGYPAKNPQTKIGYKTCFWGKNLIHLQS